MKVYSLLAMGLLALTSCERLKELEEFSGLGDDEEKVETGECVLGRKGFGSLLGKSLDVRIEGEMKGAMIYKLGAGQRKSVESDGWMKQRRWVQYYSDRKVRVTILADANPLHTRSADGFTKKDKGKVSPLLRKPIIFERADGVWRGKLEVGEASDEEVMLISRMAEKLDGRSMEGAAYGLSVRQVGDEWVMSSAILGLKRADGDVKVRLVRLLDYEGMSCAELEYVYDLAERKNQTDWMVMKGKTRAYRSLDYFLDVYRETDVSIESVSEGGAMRLVGPMKGVETVKVVSGGN